MSSGRCAQALLIGSGAALRLVLYLFAIQRQLLAVDVEVVLDSLDPALPVVLGLALPYERVSRRQTVGPAGAATATVLLTLG